MDSNPFSFTLREDNARGDYRVAAGAERLRTAVSFDDEDTSDHKSVVGVFSLGATVGASDVRSTFSVRPRPPAPRANQEVVAESFALPGRDAR